MRVLARALTPLAFLPALLVPAVPANAAPASSERVEAFIFDENLCTGGESVVGEGTIHFVLKTQKDGTAIQHVTVHGQGVGSQGNEYVIHHSSKSRSEGLFGDFQIIERTRLISKGSAPNEFIIFRWNSGEDPTVEIDCRG